MNATLYTAITVICVVLLGAAFAMNMIFLGDTQNGDEVTNVSIETFGIVCNLVVSGYLIYSIFFEHVFSKPVYELVAASILFIFTIAEVYFTIVRQTPDKAPFVYGIFCLGVIGRLVILVSSRCGNKTFTAEVVKNVVKAANDAPRDFSDKINEIWNKVSGDFNSLVNSSGKTDEEKTELRNRFRKNFGKEPRVGGKRF